MRQSQLSYRFQFWALIGAMTLTTVGCDPGGQSRPPASSGSESKPGQGSGIAPEPTTISPSPTTTVPGVVPPGGGQSSVTGAYGPAVLRRLTNSEYRSTVRDLLGLPTSPDDPLQLESRSEGYNNFAAVLAVSPTLAGQYSQLSKRVASELGDPSSLAPCAGGAAPLECGRSFITSFGMRAFRRPLTGAEVDAALALFAGELQRNNYQSAIGLIVEAFLQSPYLLYRFELGQPAGQQQALTPFELATLLAYVFTGSTPDAELLAAAEANRLSAEVELQARRLLASPQAKDTVLDVLQQWMRLSGAGTPGKDTALYPEYTPELWAAMSEETTRFINATLWDRDGTFHSLMTSRDSFANAPLASHYGLAASGLGPQLVPQALDPTQRAGLLTSAAVMAIHASADESHPIMRGKFVRERLLCQPLPPPPPELMVQPLSSDLTRTARDKLASHSADAACSGCHSLIDPLGFGLENYDAIGRFRTTDNGNPVDASGSFVGTRDIDGPFVGGVAMAEKLASSSEAAECFTLQLMQWVFGRSTIDHAADRQLASSLTTGLVAGGLDVRELLVELAKTQAFSLRTAQP